MEGEFSVRGSEASFSDWVRPDLQCYESGSPDRLCTEESVLEDISNTPLQMSGSKPVKAATTDNSHQPLAVHPAQLRRAVKRSFELLRVGLHLMFYILSSA